jgi:hypothetical protein
MSHVHRTITYHEEDNDESNAAEHSELCVSEICDFYARPFRTWQFHALRIASYLRRTGFMNAYRIAAAAAPQ